MDSIIVWTILVFVAFGIYIPIVLVTVYNHQQELEAISSMCAEIFPPEQNAEQYEKFKWCIEYPEAAKTLFGENP